MMSNGFINLSMTTISSVSTSSLIRFIHGKGGVGKSTIAKAFARQERPHSCLIHLSPTDHSENITPTHEPILNIDRVPEVTLDPFLAFKEYLGLKFKSQRVADWFTHNKLIEYLATAAPGIPEVVLLGKIWHEREHYASLTVDCPSSGHSLTLFQSLNNWMNLFGGSLVEKDAQKMLDTFGNPETCQHVIVAIPEEMAMIEALELRKSLLTLFPKQKLRLILNKKTPEFRQTGVTSETQNLFATSLTDYAINKLQHENQLLKLWSDIPYETIEWTEDSLTNMNLTELNSKEKTT